MNPKLTDWDTHLVALEFAYNSSVQASTGFSPFYLNFGHNPNLPLSLLNPLTADERPLVEAVHDFVSRMQGDLATARSNIAAAQAHMSNVANRRRRDHVFAVGDRVWVRIEKHHKLRPGKYGPYAILEVINPVAMRLDLPVSSSRACHTFHVSWLTPFQSDPQFPRDDKEMPAAAANLPLPRATPWSNS